MSISSLLKGWLCSRSSFLMNAPLRRISHRASQRVKSRRSLHSLGWRWPVAPAHNRALFVFAVMLCYPGARAAAQETNEAVSCLSMNRVRDIEVVDDDRILFYHSGGRV